MLFRQRMVRAVVSGLAVIALMAGLSVRATPASAVTTKFWKKPANSWGGQLKDGSCVYRVWYGNFGNVAVSKMRFYSGNCGGSAINGWGQIGSYRFSYYGNDASYNGTDDCGPYIEIQTSSSPNVVAVGELLYFGSTSDHVDIQYDYGSTPEWYHFC